MIAVTIHDVEIVRSAMRPEEFIVKRLSEAGIPAVMDTSHSDEDAEGDHFRIIKAFVVTSGTLSFYRSNAGSTSYEWCQ